jgi:hypothetical protein
MLPSLERAKLWIVNEHLGRRNLIDEQRGYLMGKQLESQKKKSATRNGQGRYVTAVRVFSDPYALVEQDRIENGEERWQTIGVSKES